MNAEQRREAMAEWVASRDPAAMLAWFVSDKTASNYRSCPEGFRCPTDRKLGLWADAVRDASPGVCENEPRRLARTDVIRAQQWARIHVADVPQARKAALLREIVGNPFRPVALPNIPTGLCAACGRGCHEHCGGQVSDSGIRCGCQVCWGRTCPWLTPTVLALAESAYDERGRECGQWGYDPGEPHHLCARCQGTGRIDDGTLDNDRLGILSDALEEAGCDDDAILAHLRSPGPHYRGCWVLDLLNGKE